MLGTGCGRSNLNRVRTASRLFASLLTLLFLTAVTSAIVATLLPIGHSSGSAALIVLISTLSITVFFGVVLRILLRRYEMPLEAIRDIANRYSEGNFDLSPHLGLNFRFPDIADSLTRMAERLKDRMEILVRQRNEQKAILAGMVESVIVLNPSLEVIEANPAAAALMSVTPDEAKGRSLIELLRNPDLHTFARQTLESGESRETSISLTRDGRRYLQVHGTFIKRQSTPSGMQSGDSTERLVLVLHDITTLKNLERVRRDFVANVSHELKTPVTSIKGFIETLKEGAVSDPTTADRFLGIIEKQTERMEAIIEDLLSLSRLEQSEGKLPSVSTFALHPLLAASAELVADGAAKKGIHIGLPADDSLLVTGNPSLIEQAMVNLLDNAVKFARAGGSVTVTVETEESHVSIAVADDGIGIPAKELPRIFERFYRVDRARSRQLGGTGLGLAIVKHIALAHHGEVSVESTSGAGSTFTLTLPRESGDAISQG